MQPTKLHSLKRRVKAPKIWTDTGDTGARHPKEGRCVLFKRVEEKYTFIKSRTHRFPVVLMCKVLKLHRSGYYAWLCEPHSQRKKDDTYLLGRIK